MGNKPLDIALKTLSVIAFIIIIIDAIFSCISYMVTNFYLYYDTVNSIVILDKFLITLLISVLISALVAVLILVFTITMPLKKLNKSGSIPFGCCLVSFYATYMFGYKCFNTNVAVIFLNLFVTLLFLVYSILLLIKYLEINKAKISQAKTQNTDSTITQPKKSCKSCTDFGIAVGASIACLYLITSLIFIPLSFSTITITSINDVNYTVIRDLFTYYFSNFLYVAMSALIYPILSFIKDKALDITPSKGKKPYSIVMIVLFSIYTLNFLAYTFLTFKIVCLINFLLSAFSLAYFITCTVLLSKALKKNTQPQNFGQQVYYNPNGQGYYNPNFYPNAQPNGQQFYNSNGQQFYSPNGQQYYNPNFNTNGQSNGQQFYNPNGQPNGQQFYNPNGQPNGQQFYNPNGQPNGQQFYNSNGQPNGQQFYIPTPNAQQSGQQNLNKNEVVQDNQNTNENLTITEDKQDGEKK